MRKICVVTGSRAEYGLLSGLMRAIKDDAELELQVIATNMHLSPEFGLTYRNIEEDGFTIDKKLQKGAMTGFVYKNAPANIFHTQTPAHLCYRDSNLPY